MAACWHCAAGASDWASLAGGPESCRPFGLPAVDQP